MTPDNFTDIPFTLENLDRFAIRTSIFGFIQTNATRFKGSLLDVGCGKMPYKQYLLKHGALDQYTGLDIETAIEYEKDVKPDVTWDGIKMPFSDNGFDTAFATEVLEHCPEPGIVLKEVYRVLKPGGAFFFTVPFLWPLHEVPHDEFRYTPFALKRLLLNAGFSDIELKATGGWHAALAQTLGLWVRRAPMGDSKRKMLSRVARPIIRYLIKKDKHFNIEFKESQMITGLTGVAFKPH